MCCIVCVLKGVTSTRTEEAKYGTCLTPLGQFQKSGGLVVEGCWHQQRACWAAARSRSWQSAASMDVGDWNRGKGGKSESACGLHLSPGSPGLVARESKLFGLLPSPVTFGRVLLRGSWAFLQGRIQNKRLKGLGWGVDGVLSAVPRQILCYPVMMWALREVKQDAVSSALCPLEHRAWC